MKVNTVNNQNNVNSRALKISYDAEHKIRRAESTFINNLFMIGKQHENNQFIDILVKKNLSFRIKEKANPFFCLMEPINVEKISDKKIKINALYDGVDYDLYRKGDKFNIDISLESEEMVDSVIEKYQKSNGMYKISYIAKILEKYFVNTKKDPYPMNGKRDSVVTLLMDKYGDIIV